MSGHNGLVLGLSFFVISGHREGWRLSETDNDREKLDYYRALARQSEDAHLHFMFLGDSLDGAARIDRGWTPSLDPQVLAAALAAETRSLGFIPSTSSLYQDPFTLARSLASLDHISEGRMGWNILTSFYQNTARNNYTTGRSFAYEDRYKISQDFLDTVNELWGAWDEGAVIRDRASGHYVDAAKIHPIAHDGPYFSVRGALNVSRTSQERPVFFVPVVSDGGKEFAARNADVVFTRQNNLEDAKSFYHSVKEQVRSVGRRAEDVLVTPGAIIVIGETEEAAWADFARLRPYIDSDEAIRDLEKTLGWEAGQVDRTATPASWPAVAADSGRARALLERARRDNLSIADLAVEASASRGFLLLVGTATSVADQLEAWYRQGGADGFVVGPIVAPDGVRDITEKLVPELQRRGVFREAASLGQTLRQSLGLPAVTR
ncbi:MULTISPECIES: NtaA/DmoA family FMN-dependent monooxygenase [unclassified Chelatococcus]|uniref:NtaA/DmoA family FMN-dependent monooxygenase n=1 Tax=unclassified Chelatococcus TaxID=2638111 RepID=UPI001BCBE2AF|nr:MULTISPECIES: NtaA/DmoA family FMN-dependent monooxygenase [unclassified Chelatococcus]MBS7743704.1 NtaA/DmoA family FMN-dependent monooxygenase [Chelatococcus sp. HY11]MBX3547396.1 NtaA/DmoA family FMN-dependent monooxygenase [Chelatococcus sp.]CAH1664497.1 putative N-acetyl-S-(2-succino)cysteine monooxygenase [Hyphomicrobiales bacterium]CAH1688309.1 putative N-acetyl-S-(2-succino)cysteine monooxygenase [Hyphomicrobiales bacterium]